MGMFSESVDVVCTPSGQPLKLRWARQAIHGLRGAGALV